MLRYLVTDYDHCAARNDSTRPDLLSTTLINRALDPQFNYKGFYGCTHRSSLTAFFVKYPFINPVIRYCFSKHTREQIENLSTTRITENFAKATKLTCQAVSMINDLVLKKCGAMYKNVIEPYEHSKRSVPWNSFSALRLLAANTHTKNLQLLHIAEDVAAKHQGVPVTLDFVDDKLHLCQQAVEASNQLNWPKNVTLNVLHHDKQRNLIEVTSPPPLPQPYSLGRIGFFAAATAATVYSAMTAVHNVYARSMAAPTA